MTDLAVPGWKDVGGLVYGFGGRGASPPEGILQVRQVHGARVVDAGDPDLAVAADSGDLARAAEADAISITRPGVVAGVRTADCVPVLLLALAETGEPRWAAAIHAGWRGTIAGVVDAAVAQTEIEPSGLSASLGPSIGPCCYEVSEAVAGRFRSAGYPVVESVGVKPHLDLRAINRLRLLACGLDPRRIFLVGPCTRCRSDLYHSYRYDPDDPGRQLSWIGWEDRTPDRDPQESR